MKKMKNEHRILLSSEKESTRLPRKPFFEQRIKMQEDRKKNDFQNDYIPSENEPYMNPRQLEYFKGRLLFWRDLIERDAIETLQSLRAGGERETDILDRGASDTLSALVFHTKDRHHKLMKKIDAALERVESGTYGYCEETGEEIGIKRLEARPIATLSLEAQEWHERREGRKRKTAYR